MITFFDSLIGMNVRFWAKLLDMFREFRSFVAIRDGFYAKFWGVASLARQKRAIRESFLCE